MFYRAFFNSIIDKVPLNSFMYFNIEINILDLIQFWMWKSAYVGVYQLLNWKMHGEILKFENAQQAKPYNI